jgi:hypothetical protein
MDDIAKELGLQARQFRLERSGKDRPSQELMHFWFINRVGVVRKKDVGAFDAWMRSPDGIVPHRSPNCFQNSTFPRKDWTSDSFDRSSAHVFLLDETRKQWSISLKGLELLAANVHRLPSL